jgi:hypothetical protein
VIEAAADRQMRFLQDCASGDRVADSQRLLNEVAAARLCLLIPLDPGAKGRLRPAVAAWIGRAARRSRSREVWFRPIIGPGT